MSGNTAAETLVPEAASRLPRVKHAYCRCADYSLALCGAPRRKPKDQLSNTPPPPSEFCVVCRDLYHTPCSPGCTRR